MQTSKPLKQHIRFYDIFLEGAYCRGPWTCSWHSQGEGGGLIQKPKPSPPVHAPGKICASTEGYSPLKPNISSVNTAKHCNIHWKPNWGWGSNTYSRPPTPPIYRKRPWRPVIIRPWYSICFFQLSSFQLSSLLTLYKSLFKCRLFYTLSLVYRKSTNHIWLQYTNPSTQISDEWCNIMNHFRRFLLDSGIISQQFAE